MISTKIRQRLQLISPEHYARLQVIEAKAHSLLEFAQGGVHLSFTPHGLSHISAVESNYDWLLVDPDRDSLNAPEIFCLLCATFFHDVLMIPQKIGGEADARAEHAIRAKDFLLKTHEQLGLATAEADAISHIIRAHAVNNFSDIPDKTVLINTMIGIRKLGACLSLADLCHADFSRAPEIVFNYLELDPDSKFHWRRHMQISGITRDENTILLSAVTFSKEGSEAIHEYKILIERQLEIIKPYFDTIFKPLRKVELIEQKLASPLDQTLQFKTNNPAILKLLIEGVYDRNDVFVRELVQNSLDSCLVKRAKQSKRNVEYSPQIIMTLFKKGDRYVAFRVDDNGIGMSLSDVQDTVMWIGSSISSREDIVKLLQDTLGKNLIATFGIGLLSCFKASNSVVISTYKEKETPLKFTLSGVSDSVKTETSDDSLIGTTITVNITEDLNVKLNLLESIKHYFRSVFQVDLRILELEWTAESLSLQRSSLFKIATTESQSVQPYSYPDEDECFVSTSVNGDDFSGRFWLENSEPDEIRAHEGKIDILNEGIYVTSELSSVWLSKSLSMCDGIINFSSKSISLPAGRDRVIHDSVYELKIRQFNIKSFSVVELLIKMSSTSNIAGRDAAALVITHVFNEADEPFKLKMLRHMGDFKVKTFKRHDLLTLDTVYNTQGNVYLQHPKGRFVNDLTYMDGKLLYHKDDDLVELQATMMAQSGEIVISAATSQAAYIIREADLLSAYFDFVKKKFVDLTKENVIEGKQRSKPLSLYFRQEIGSSVKFIDIPGLPTKRAWKVGNELWINLGNPRMNAIYSQLNTQNYDTEKAVLLNIMTKIMMYDFDGAMNLISNSLE